MGTTRTISVQRTEIRLPTCPNWISVAPLGSQNHWRGVCRSQFIIGTGLSESASLIRTGKNRRRSCASSKEASSDVPCEHRHPDSGCNPALVREQRSFLRLMDLSVVSRPAGSAIKGRKSCVWRRGMTVGGGSDGKYGCGEALSIAG